MTKTRLAVITLGVFSVGLLSGYILAYEDDVIDQQVKTQINANERIPCNESNIVFNSGENLQNKLVRAQQEIFQLESFNQALSKQIKRVESFEPQTTTYADLVRRVDKLPAEAVKRLMARIFDEAYLDKIDNPNEFAKKLISIALSENPDDEDSDNTEVRVEIEFSLSPVAGLRQFVDINELDQYDMIFVHFIAPESFDNLIVRWQYSDTGEILRFRPMQLSDNLGYYHWLRLTDGWKSGQYRVDVFDLNAEQQLVGTNIFNVRSISEQTLEDAEFQYDADVMQDLISSGKAVLKTIY